MIDQDRLAKIATLCGNCNCGCPEVFIDPLGTPDREIVITDDFGQQVQMSREQFAELAELAGTAAGGRLDVVTANDLPTPA